MVGVWYKETARCAPRETTDIKKHYGKKGGRGVRAVLLGLLDCPAELDNKF